MKTRRGAPGVVLFALLLLCGGCDDDSPATTPGGTSTISGREQLAWDQEAPSLAALNSYTFNALVDGTPAGALTAQCTANGSTSYTCISPLPPLSAGSHKIAVQTNGSDGTSSAVSNTLSVVVQGASMTTALASRVMQSLPLTAARVCLGSGANGSCYELRRIASQLSSPSHPRQLPDGRIVVIDSGRLLEVQDGEVRPVAIDGRPGTRIAEIEAAPDFLTSREVYILEVASAGGRRSVDVVRFRDVNSVLGQRAVIVPAVPLPQEGDPVLFVDDQIVLAIPGDTRGFGTLLKYNRQGGSEGQTAGSPAMAWGPGRPTALLKMGTQMTVAGVAPGGMLFGTLATGATIPAANALEVRLAPVGGVRGVVRTGKSTLFATGDGALYLAGEDRNGEFTSLQFIDTRGAVITGMDATAEGGVIATTVMPVPQDPHSGTLYQLTPVR